MNCYVGEEKEFRGISLRSELSVRGLRYASQYGLQHELTDGETPSILFAYDEDGRHGNFHAASYASILGTSGWAGRLEKAHTGYRKARARANWKWRELDCSNSSDALLMNIFCYPGVTNRDSVRSMLGVVRGAMPEFGFKPRTPLKHGGGDRTEIDMKLGELLVEAKLTESDFQVADPRLLHRYRDFETVFDCDALPLRRGKYGGYQLIRGALAAYASGCSFAVFCDSRRPELIEEWYRVLAAIHILNLRCRLKLLTWRELAAVLPGELQQFLATKYGIVPPDSINPGNQPRKSRSKLIFQTLPEVRTR